MAGGNKRGMKTRTTGPPPPASDDVHVTEEEPLSTPWWRWQALTKIPTHLKQMKALDDIPTTEEPPNFGENVRAYAATMNLRSLMYCWITGAVVDSFIWTLEISWFYGIMIKLFFLAVTFIVVPD